MSTAYPHIEWLDLHGKGVLTECAVMRKDANGNIYHFQIASLDSIDKTRLRNILVSRNAKNFPLWDLMQQVTLGNGINALEYFHQLVKVLTPSGQIIDATHGRMGASVVRRTSDLKKPDPTSATGTVSTETQNGSPNVGEVDAYKPVADVTPNVGEVDNRTPAQKRADTLAAKKAAQ